MQITSTETANPRTAERSIYDEIAPILNEAKKKAEKKKLTLEEILGVDRTTVWRWENKLNKNSPNADTVLNLLSFITNETVIPNILKKFDDCPQIQKLINISFPSRVHSMARKSKDIYKIDDQYDFYIYYICGTQRGATKEELTYTLGKIAAKKAEIPESHQTYDMILSLGQFTSEKIDNLEALEIIEKSNSGRYIRTQRDTYIEVEEGLKRTLQTIKDFVEPEQWGEGMTTFYAFQESIPTEVAQEIARETYQFYTRMKQKMMSNRTSDKSSVPYIISNCAETLSFNQGRAQGGIQ